MFAYVVGVNNNNSAAEKVLKLLGYANKIMKTFSPSHFAGFWNSAAARPDPDMTLLSLVLY